MKSEIENLEDGSDRADQEKLKLQAELHEARQQSERSERRQHELEATIAGKEKAAMEAADELEKRLAAQEKAYQKKLKEMQELQTANATLTNELMAKTKEYGKLHDGTAGATLGVERNKQMIENAKLKSRNDELQMKLKNATKSLEDSESKLKQALTPAISDPKVQMTRVVAQSLARHCLNMRRPSKEAREIAEEVHNINADAIPSLETVHSESESDAEEKKETLAAEIHDVIVGDDKSSVPDTPEAKDEEEKKVEEVFINYSYQSRRKSVGLTSTIQEEIQTDPVLEEEMSFAQCETSVVVVPSGRGEGKTNPLVVEADVASLEIVRKVERTECGEESGSAELRVGSGPEVTVTPTLHKKAELASTATESLLLLCEVTALCGAADIVPQNKPAVLSLENLIDINLRRSIQPLQLSSLKECEISYIRPKTDCATEPSVGGALSCADMDTVEIALSRKLHALEYAIAVSEQSFVPAVSTRYNNVLAELEGLSIAATKKKPVCSLVSQVGIDVVCKKAKIVHTVVGSVSEVDICHFTPRTEVATESALGVTLSYTSAAVEIAVARKRQVLVYADSLTEQSFAAQTKTKPRNNQTESELGEVSISPNASEEAKSVKSEERSTCDEGSRKMTAGFEESKRRSSLVPVLNIDPLKSFFMLVFISGFDRLDCAGDSAQQPGYSRVDLGKFPPKQRVAELRADVWAGGEGEGAVQQVGGVAAGGHCSAECTGYGGTPAGDEQAVWAQDRDESLECAYEN